MPTITDKSMEIPGNDGMYFFGAYHKQKQFNINIAFDSLTEKQLRTLRQVFNGKEVGELIFDELPFKAYSAKITGTPQIKAICFDDVDEKGNYSRVYRGEGTLTFTCYLPYSYTPNWVWDWKDAQKKELIQREADGKVLTNYNQEIYTNKGDWKGSYGLFDNEPQELINNGDLPAPFKVNLAAVTAGTKINIANNEIVVLEDCADFVWDSKTGMVSGYVNFPLPLIGGEFRPIQYSGQSCGAIPANGISQIAEMTKEDKVTSVLNNIEYSLWYY